MSTRTRCIKSDNLNKRFGLNSGLRRTLIFTIDERSRRCRRRLHAIVSIGRRHGSELNASRCQGWYKSYFPNLYRVIVLPMTTL